MNQAMQNLGRAISQRVHSRRLQLRLQIGSSAALASGLIATIILLSKTLAAWNAVFFDFFVGTPTSGMALQDDFVGIVIIFLLALLGGATLPHFRFLSATALTLLYAVIYLGYALEHFSRGIVVQPIYPVIALGLTHTSVMIYRYWAEDRPRESIGNLFRRYLSVEAMDQVMKDYDKEALALDGIRREVTVLHVDLRDLSTAADELSPSGAVRLVNQYFAAIVPNIFEHTGTIVKQSGNGIVAVWNLPSEKENYADAAVQAALQISRAVAPLRAMRTTEDMVISKIYLGYGIASGTALGGHIGVRTHSEYTIIGEVITVAERLAMKPDRGVFVEGKTREKLRGEYALREVNPVRLRRQTDPVAVWEVVEPLELEPLELEPANAAK